MKKREKREKRGVRKTRFFGNRGFREKVEKWAKKGPQKTRFREKGSRKTPLPC